MTLAYKRRKPALLRNFWIYRYLIAAAVLLGVMLWFVWINSTEVTVTFPFRLGKIESKLGVVILLSALAGSLVTALVMALILALRRLRSTGSKDEEDGSSTLPDDRPPIDYASKTPEGFSDARWKSPGP